LVRATLVRHRTPFETCTQVYPDNRVLVPCAHALRQPRGFHHSSPRPLFHSKFKKLRRARALRARALRARALRAARSVFPAHLLEIAAGSEGVNEESTEPKQVYVGS
jgi:hypothetical protein